MHIQHKIIQVLMRIWPNISWDTQVLHIQRNPMQLHMLIWPNISWDTQVMQGLLPKPINTKKTDLKTTNFPKVLPPFRK